MGTKPMNDDEGYWESLEQDAANHVDPEDDDSPSNVTVMPNEASLSYDAVVKAHEPVFSTVETPADRMRPVAVDWDLPPTAPPQYLSGVSEDGADVHNLLYKGKTHLFTALPGHGKSWVLLIAASDFIKQGKIVWYLNADRMGQRETADRLLDLGCTRQQIDAAFRYSQHTDRWGPDAGKSIAGWASEDSPELVLVDTMGQSVVKNMGGSSKEGSDVTVWWQAYVDSIRSACPEATFVIADHQPKNDSENDMKGILGAQEKQGMVDVHMTMRAIEPLTRGHEGLFQLTVQKDGLGHYIWTENGNPASLYVTPGMPTYQWRLSFPDSNGIVGSHDWPFQAMENVSYVLQTCGPLNGKELRQQVGGKNATREKAVERLVELGYLTITDGGPGTPKIHTLVTPYSSPMRTTPAGGSEGPATDVEDDDEEFPF